MARRRDKEPEGNPLIIRRVVRRGGHHGGTWKVAYSDFMTTMMALFIVLWAASQSEPVRHAIAGYFRAAHVLSTTGHGATVLPEPPPPATTETEPEDFVALRRAADELLRLLQADPLWNELKDQVLIEVTDEGLRIQLVERDGHLLFGIGSAEVRPATARVLALIAHVVQTLPNPVRVEGHTDARQYPNQRAGYTNWELSADRANAARRLLQESGLRAGQIRQVIGHADQDLFTPSDPLDARNRRISILVAALRRR
jgi:chemotaxis protein MotB